MVNKADLLIEIGTEELPPRALMKLTDAFAKNVTKALSMTDLGHGETQVFATPRRLALILRDVKTGQADMKIEKQGPSVQAPEKAKEGFARSCGVSVDELTIVETDKGQKLSYTIDEKGKQARELIPVIIEKALAALPIPKRMRWGDGDVEFVRPVKWVVLLHGESVIDTEILGVKTGSQTVGHRFHHPESMQVTVDDYEERLLEGMVIADFNKRRDVIRDQVIECATQLGGEAVVDSGLLDEVTAIVEWPVVLAGNFETEFLNVPHEALIYTMQDNQKYFPVKDKAGNLLPHFITVCNIESSNPQVVIEGNERVIRPRLADASFFWEQDKKKSLGSHNESLKKIIFQKQLGTLHDKTERVVELAGYIAEKVGADVAQTKRAAALSKCDLMTDMVGEFGAMQGIAGRYYASHDEETDVVATALEQQYWPKFAGDQLPENGVSQSLALADKVDTMVGIFGIGQPPTGSKDPFALRRAALSIVRIIIEKKLNLDLLALFEKSESLFVDNLTEKDSAQQVYHYSIDRLLAYYQDQGFKKEVIDAVSAAEVTNPVDFDRRVRAVTAFNQMPEAENLIVASKRIDNILRKSDEVITHVEKSVLTEDAEKELFQQIEQLQSTVIPLFEQGSYESALSELSALRKPVDDFFDNVMVMDEDLKLRKNRLALLDQLRSLFLHVVDLSCLHSE